MSVLTTLDNVSGDVPAARFGHTTTFVGNYTIIMFGGAVGDSGRYTITNDTFLLDLSTLKWSTIVAESCPSARAAHASACVDSMQFVIYGGATGGGSLSSDELYLLDLRKAPALAWMTVPITGATPGRRYGHTICYHKPNLVVFGGNDGQRSVNDIWYMDVEKSPFCWNAVVMAPGTKQPMPRVYHSADICKEGPAGGMMVVFGGRGYDSKSLLDSWGLRQHRDGRWDWLEAPTKKGLPPDARFQHTAVFVGSRMLVIGGRESDVTRALPTAVYDTETCDWKALPSMARFRHSSWCFESTVYTFGGFDHHAQSSPTSDLQSLDISLQPGFFTEKDQDVVRRIAVGSRALPASSSATSIRQPAAGTRTAPAVPPVFRTMSSPNSIAKISTHVHTRIDSDFSALVRKVSIDRLEDEGRKIKGHHPDIHLHSIIESEDSLANRVIRRILQPNVTSAQMERDFSPHSPFSLSWEEVSALCIMVYELVLMEETVLEIRTPVKVYGDIHGQYYDMMRLFASYKCPVGEDWKDENDITDPGLSGDIDSNDYLFLGDFVDRGTNSLEVVCLLFALKCKYPKQVHLLRGNHEDPSINSIYGFKEECKRRLKEDPDHYDSCWDKFNQVFEMLPLGAVIESKILCIHGGIGGSIHTLDHIASLQRPLKVSQIPNTDIERRVTDLLWSDPTDNDSLLGVMPNDTRDPDGSGHIVKFGPDRVSKFLHDNNLDMIIRAHECVMDGFERFAGGKLITLFSATDYCGHHKNAGALLFIRRDLTIIPKIIYPSDRETSIFKSTWINVDSRPPTPPRSYGRRTRESDIMF